MTRLSQSGQFFLVLCILIVLSIYVGTSVEAQGFAERVTGVAGFTDLSWSVDSQTLSMSDGTSRLLSSNLGQWYEYNPTTRSLIQTAQWPRQPILTSTELALYQPATNTYTSREVIITEPSFIFTSPNNTYLVYASNVGAGEGFPIMLAHRPSQLVAETYLNTRSPTRGLRRFRVVWNRTSTAFVVASLPPSIGDVETLVQAHVTNFTSTLTNLQTTPAKLFPVIAGQEHFTTVPFSVSDDGNFVLLRAKNLITDTERLVIWNVSAHTYTLVGNFDGKDVAGASFDQGNPDIVLMINGSGFVRYTRSTQQSIVLNSQATSAWGPIAVFSLDSRRLAILRQEQSSGLSLYVFDLTTDFIPTATPPVSGVKVQYYPESTTRTQYVESIIPTLNIVNTTSTAYNLSDFKVRYYFKRENTQAPQGACAWTALPGNCANVTVSAGLLPIPRYTADAYLEVGFTSGILSANSQTFEIIVRANAQDWSDFYQWDDYSFDPTSTSDTFKDWDKVTLYYMGTRIWGWEPD